MPSECHYAVCTRCRVTVHKTPCALQERRVARNDVGEFVIRAAQARGCRICGQSEVEIRWGVPPHRHPPYDWGNRWMPGERRTSPPGERDPRNSTTIDRSGRFSAGA